MANRPYQTKSIAVAPATYKAIQEIMKLPHMLSEDGLTRPYKIVMSEIVDFYNQAHQKGRR
jgi:hypothetical protein